MAPEPFRLRTSENVSTKVWKRMLFAMYRQSYYTAWCPKEPSQTGRVAVVTGGNRGCGFEVAKGLLARGAEVTITARTAANAKEALDELRKTAPAVSSVELDLSDLDTVPKCVTQLKQQLGTKKINILVENAGMWPTGNEVTKQGHEVAFGTNVLGHFTLREGLRGAGLLADDARIVVTTGDIYIKSSECTPDFKHSGGHSGSEMAYARSKLGNIQIAFELQRRYPNYHVVCAHPGVFNSNLFKGYELIKKMMFVSAEVGAQTPLIAATQPSVEKGAYLHNTYGVMKLRASDPAMNSEAGAKLWTLLEQLSARRE